MTGCQPKKEGKKYGCLAERDCDLRRTNIYNSVCDGKMGVINGGGRSSFKRKSEEVRKGEMQKMRNSEQLRREDECVMKKSY